MNTSEKMSVDSIQATTSTAGTQIESSQTTKDAAIRFSFLVVMNAYIQKRLLND